MSRILALPQDVPVRPAPFSRRRAFWVASLVGFVLYMIVVGTIPVSLVMWQGFDDALFVRLGMHLANGDWLGPYDRLTLVKVPGYPLFLALSHFTGLPINIVQFGLYYWSGLFFAVAVGRATGFRWLALFCLLVILLNPSLYEPGLQRLIRAQFYLSAVLLTFGGWLWLFLGPRTTRPRRYAVAVLTGVATAVAWVTREESVVLLPGIAVIVLAGFLLRRDIGVSWWQQARSIAIAVVLAGIGYAAVIITISALNQAHYGRFTTTEMTDPAFQRAMVALQRAGGGEVAYVPMPTSVRLRLYELSPALAELRPFLDPPGRPVDHPENCRQLPTTCGEIAGGLFMWALREAAGQAGKHTSAAAAAAYYETLASEIEAICDSGAIDCLDWLPPLIPPIPASQWQELPGAFGRAIDHVLFNVGVNPRLGTPSSSLNTPDSAAAYLFLNQPLLDTEPLIQDGVRSDIREAWYDVTGWSQTLLGWLVIAGAAALALSILVAPIAVFRGPGIWVAGALLAFALAHLVVLSLTHISSFLSLYHQRTVVAEPILFVVALVSIATALTTVPAGVARLVRRLRGARPAANGDLAPGPGS